MIEEDKMADRAFKQIPMFSGEKSNEVEEWLEKVDLAMTLVPNTVTDAQRVASLRLRMEKTAFAWAQTTTTEQRATVAAFRNTIHA